MALGRQGAGQNKCSRSAQNNNLTGNDPQWRTEKPGDHGCRQDNNDRKPLRFAINAAVAVPVVDQRPEGAVFSQPAIQPRRGTGERESGDQQERRRGQQRQYHAHGPYDEGRQAREQPK